MSSTCKISLRVYLEQVLSIAHNCRTTKMRLRLAILSNIIILKFCLLLCKWPWRSLKVIKTARIVTGKRKFDRGLGQILHDQLHWLDVPDRVLFKLAVTVHHAVSERPRTTVSVGALHPGLQCWHAAASAFRQPSPTWCRVSGSTLTAVGRSQLLARWPGTLSLGFHPGSNEQHRLF